MNSIYNFLRPAWQELTRESKENLVLIPFIMLLVSFPASLAINNICLVFFLLSVILFRKKLVWNWNFYLILPVLFFIWMCFSYFWSYEPENTIKALSKESTLLLVPLAFSFLPQFTRNQIHLIFKYYSYSMLIYALYFLIRAFIRYFISFDSSVFFYHGPQNDIDTGLVPRLLNAIHVSVYMALAFFYFFIKDTKSIIEKIGLSVLFIFILLLSSKNIIVIFILLILLYLFYYSKIANRLRLRNLVILLLVLGVIFSFNKIKERFIIEFTSNTEKSLSHSVEINHKQGVNNISIYQAWKTERFTYNDYFPGTAFRVYQIRIFNEMLYENPIFWKGFGLNASQNKIKEKEKEHHLYPGYGNYNFHNQYIQVFAELGIIGLLFLLIILISNVCKAFLAKDFLHIAFAVLMISLFLTESFLWRQRGVGFFIILFALFMHNKVKCFSFKKGLT